MFLKYRVSQDSMTFKCLKLKYEKCVQYNNCSTCYTRFERVSLMFWSTLVPFLDRGYFKLQTVLLCSTVTRLRQKKLVIQKKESEIWHRKEDKGIETS